MTFRIGFIYRLPWYSYLNRASRLVFAAAVGCDVIQTDVVHLLGCIYGWRLKIRYSGLGHTEQETVGNDPSIMCSVPSKSLECSRNRKLDTGKCPTHPSIDGCDKISMFQPFISGVNIHASQGCEDLVRAVYRSASFEILDSQKLSIYHKFR